MKAPSKVSSAIRPPPTLPQSLMDAPSAALPIQRGETRRSQLRRLSGDSGSLEHGYGSSAGHRPKPIHRLSRAGSAYGLTL
jgi:hypothetical protein